MIAGRSARELGRVAGEFFWVGVGQAAAVIGSIVGLRVLTGALGTVEFGRLALALTLSTLLGLSVFSGPGAATMRFFGAARESGELPAMITAAARTVWKRAMVVIALTLVVVLVLWSRGAADLASIGVATLLQALFTSFSTVLDGAQNAARQRRTVALHQGMSQWMRWIAALPLFTAFGNTAASALWGYTIATAVVFGSQLLFFRRSFGVEVYRGARGSAAVEPWMKTIGSYALPYSYWGLPYWLHMSSERWGLERFSGAHSVGLYAVVAQLGFGMMTLFSNLVVQLVSPLLFHRAGDGSSPDRMQAVHRMNERLLLACFLLTALATVAGAMFHETLFGWFVAPDFHQVSYLLPVSILSGGLFACGQVALLSVSSGVTNVPLLAPKIGSAAIGVVLTLAAAARWGVVGVVGANLLSSAVYCLWVIVTALGAHRRTRGAVVNLGQARELGT
jgi:O-antigen/teichoic acid export membrane protein